MKYGKIRILLGHISLYSKLQCMSLKLKVDLKRNIDFRNLFLSRKKKKRIVMANETVFLCDNCLCD